MNIKSIFHATKKNSIVGQIGMIIGSKEPWVEAICIRNGAKKIITVDYYKELETHFESISYKNAIELCKESESYFETMDFMVSFSSIEHSGLGRYGDPLDPFADIKEVEKIWCILKPGGILFLGFHIGIDSIVFNFHRIYGFLRLPLLFQGYNLIETYFDTNEKPFQFTKESIEYAMFNQYLFVLQKQY
uniref:Methyltransferase type 11 domain-containing protein n=1 Tax=Acrobeloides nanus TaxID=290746 RepID=A0A914CEU0_9BILA